MRYADVILPLPLEGMFTYSIPDEMSGRVRQGIRVLVPLGRSKTYTAMTASVHDDKPQFETRPIISVLDDKPVLLPQQYKLWTWVADYYMSAIGDVFKAALPPGLKSEEGYRPRTETYITLAPNLRSAQAITIAMSMLRRSQRQQQVFATYLALSGWEAIARGQTDCPTADITREELMNECHCTSAIIRQLTDRKFLVCYEREVGRLTDGGDTRMELMKPLNAVQTAAHDDILRQMDSHNLVLLHGVTSSGKTEIYIHLIAEALRKGQQVLYLLPEIALTVQITSRLRHVFGGRLGIYHSKYSDAERVEIWQKQLSDQPYDIILGARSAVWLPFQRLGLVIIDEEHESSFKQQDPAPRYHARSAAIVLASLYGAKTLLGTATPSAESYHNALTGKYGLVRLTARYKDIALPEIRVVDVKDLRRRKIMRSPFSPDLLCAMRDALAGGRQVILFQNRRGFAPMIECHTCGWVPKCNNCDVSLTYHKNTGILTCHYCGYAYAVPKKCPNCEDTDLRGRGLGTEKIEDFIRELFPEARVARMDLDTTRTRNAYERIINDFSAGKTDILIGTQMISKGLDFDNVSVVGILDADSMLNYPDFRAYEHAFMMMAQVSGRAGRKGQRGLVILQTKNPDLPVISQVVSNDYDAFFRSLSEERAMFHYPPHTHLVYVYLKHRDERTADTAATEFASRLRAYLGSRILGPDKPPVARVKTLSIRKIMIKLENGIDFGKVRLCLRQQQELMLKDKRYGALQMYYDVDPL